MKYRFMRLFAGLTLFTTPAVAFAQNTGPISTGAVGFIDRVIFIMNSRIIPLIILIALITFLYGVYQYVQKPSGLTGARDTILYGLVGLFVMVSVWGLINFVGDTFGVATGGQQSPITPILNPNKNGI